MHVTIVPIVEGETPIREGSPVINGVNVDSISLNSSRSRLRRDSHGSPKHQRKSVPSSSGNGKTDEIRRVSSAANPRELPKSDQDREPATSLRKKDKENGRLSVDRKEANRVSSGIVLDVDSILDELLGDGDSEPETSSLNVHSDRKSALRNSPSPSLRVELADPPKPKKGNALETTVTRRSMLVSTNENSKDTGKTTTTTTASTSTSGYTSDRKPPISPSKKMSSPGRLRSLDSPSTTKSASSPVEEKESARPPSRSPDLREDVKETLKSSPKRVPNGTFRVADDLGGDDDHTSNRSRARSNAIAKTDSQRYSANLKVSSKDQKADEEQPTSPRLRDKSKRRTRADSIDEGRPQRSGSWSRMRHLVNSKALGMFYHNRRSQVIDHENLDDAEARVSGDRGSSLERSDSSTSTPHSPTVLSPRSRDSRSFSPNVVSPLASKQQNFDEAHASLVEKKEKEESGSTSATPTTHSASSASSSLAPPRVDHDSEEPEVT